MLLAQLAIYSFRPLCPKAVVRDFFLAGSEEIVREHTYSRRKFVKKANHLANCVQVISNSKKSDVAKFATCSEPI